MLRKYRTTRRDRVVLLYIKYTTKANIAAGGSRLRRGHIDQNSYRTINMEREHTITRKKHGGGKRKSRKL